MTDKDDDIYIPEVSVDSIMARIREEDHRRRLKQLEAVPAEGTSSINAAPIIDISSLHSIITATEKNVDVGVEITPMAEFKGLTRKLAIFVGKKIIFLASFITFKQRDFNRGVIGALRTIAGNLEKLGVELPATLRHEAQQHVEAINQHICALGDELRDSFTENKFTLESLRSAHEEARSNVQNLGNAQSEQSAELARFRDGHATTGQELTNLISTIQENIINDFSSRLFERDALIKSLEQRVATLQTSITFQERRTNTFLQEAGNRREHSSEGSHGDHFAEEKGHLLDGLYVAFEDKFRGSREEIRERVQIYLPFIKEAGAGSAEGPVLDVGCGRGEWLELLREEGLHGRGIDLNRYMVKQCRERELDVTEADVIAYLRSLPNASLGAITGFHIIEHLPFETLIAMLDETLRVLKSGGVAIFETPNPQNVLVGSCNFYLDPTHGNPLPSPLIKFITESRGLHDVQILNLNPSNARNIPEDNELAMKFNEYFYGPMDYAIIGWRI